MEKKRWKELGVSIFLILVVIAGFSLVSAQTKSSSKSEAPIKIGWIGPLSGISAEDGAKMLRGTKLAFEEVKWEIAGRKIQLLVEDSPMDPSVALVKLKKLQHDDKIDLLIGPYSSASGLAVRDFIHDNKILTVSPQTSVAALTQERFSKYFFRTWNASGQIAPFEGWALTKLGYRTVAFFAPDFAAGRDQVTGVRKGFEKFGGRVLQEVYFPLGRTMDFAPLLAKLDVEKPPDAVYVWAVGGDAVRFVKQYADYGYKKIPFITHTAVADSYLAAQGDAALGAFTFFWYGHTLNTAENRRFKKSYADVFGAEAAKILAPHDEQGYLAGKIVVKGVQAVNGNTKDVDGMIRAIEKLEFEAPRGPFKFYQHNGVFNEYLWQVNRVEGRLLTTVVRGWGPIRQGWFEDGLQIPEVSVPRE